MSDNRVELRACPNPWCDPDDDWPEIEHKEGGFFRVACSCGVATPAFTDEDQAWKCWNTRALDPSIESLQAEVERLREALGLATMLLREMRNTLDDGGQVGPVSVIDNVLAKIGQALAAKEQTRDR